MCRRSNARIPSGNKRKGMPGKHALSASVFTSFTATCLLQLVYSNFIEMLVATSLLSAPSDDHHRSGRRHSSALRHRQRDDYHHLRQKSVHRSARSHGHRPAHHATPRSWERRASRRDIRRKVSARWAAAYPVADASRLSPIRHRRDRSCASANWERFGSSSFPPIFPRMHDPVKYPKPRVTYRYARAAG